MTMYELLGLVKARKLLNWSLLILYLLVDVIAAGVILLTLFPRFAGAITEQAFLSDDLVLISRVTLASIVLVCIFFGLATLRSFPQQNWKASLSLLASVLSLGLVAWQADDLLTSLYLFAIVEIVGLLAGFIFTVAVPLLFRDESERSVRGITVSTQLMLVAALYLMMLLIELEYYGYLVFIQTTHPSLAAFGGWMMIQLPVVVQRTRDAAAFHKQNHVEKLAQLAKKEVIRASYHSEPRDRNLIQTKD